MDKRPYEPLDAGTLSRRLSAAPGLAERIGPAEHWRVREVGDGNLNLVFIIEGPLGAAIAKQALPYARCVGDSWPMSLERSYFEYHALIRLGQRDPGRLPHVFAFDQEQALIVMEYFTPHVILRKSLMAGEVLPQLERHIGQYLARTLFRGSDFAMQTAHRKSDLALFAGNVELCGISEDLIFTDPFCVSPRNRVTPGLEGDAAAVRADRDLKLAAAALKRRFATGAETLLHGDFHSGSVMVTAQDSRVIDPEFAFYGPMGFDIGAFLGNLLMAYFANAGRGTPEAAREAYGDWILQLAEGVWASFEDEFARLWRTERTGMLALTELFEDTADPQGAEAALAAVLRDIWRDTLGFAGIEMHRRILGLAHIPEFETIEDEALRAACERRALAMGRRLMLQPDTLCAPRQISRLARSVRTV
ncbi:S-methyl-5-thioribose kinase [Roseixanthobacter glucoisosaccharinicivorans]|uniref:S-methyl-5-thioribose kinase n=1 Tax=Roseixanthobacter glucoisosaccharinicivorans TaxID=3119923 RepID=UPI00372D16B2